MCVAICGLQTAHMCECEFLQSFWAGHWLSPPPSYQIYTTIYGLGMESFPKLIGRLNALGKEIAEM